MNCKRSYAKRPSRKTASASEERCGQRLHCSTRGLPCELPQGYGLDYSKRGYPVLPLRTLAERSVRRLLKRSGFELRRTKSREDATQYVKLYGEQAVQERRFYNVGAGKFRHKCWTNVDFSTDWYDDQQRGGAHLEWNMMTQTPLPVETGTAEIIYCSHVIEHVPDDAGERFLAEAYRALKPGGVLRITCPNVDLAYAAYRADDRDFFYWKRLYRDKERAARIQLNRPMTEASAAQLFLWFFATHASELHADGAPSRVSDEQLRRWFEESPFTEVLDRCTALCDPSKQGRYPGNHINWYNPEKLLSAMRRAGFSTAVQSGYGQSAAPVLREVSQFDNTHPKMSLYAEARR